MVKINVNLPNGDDGFVEIETHGNLQNLKIEIAKKFDIPALTQRIIYKGVALSENFPLHEYGIKDDAKVTVLQKKEGEANCSVLREALYRYFRQFYNELDSSKLAYEFMLYYYKYVLSLNLDDLEKCCTGFLKDEEKMAPKSS